MSIVDLSVFLSSPPPAPSKRLRYVDVGVTASAKEFSGFYRGKQYHVPDFASTLDRAGQAGVEKVLLTGMSTSDLGFNDGICMGRFNMEKGPKCYLTTGVHPYHANELAAEPERSQNLDMLARHIDEDISQRRCFIAAFGEIGLDFDRTEHASKDVQIQTFRAQLDLFVSKGWNLPLFLHCRNAFDTFIESITPYIPKLPRDGLVHSFVGSTAQMQQLCKLGLDVSVNGFSFRTQESLDMVAALPLDRLHLETDAPWGEIKATSELVARYCRYAGEAPGSKDRKKWDKGFMVKERNESCMIERVAFIVAGLKGVSVEEVAEAAWKNSVRLFGWEG